MNNHKQKEASLSEELPYWDFFDEPKPHAVLIDGSVVAGLEMTLADIECFDERETNQFTAGLRSALNSISENTTMQFVLSVRSDYSDVIEKHVSGKNLMAHSLVNKIADFREKRLLASQDSGELYRPNLRVYIRAKPIPSKKVSIFKKKENFSQVSKDAYLETLENLNQNLENIISSFSALGIQSRALSKNEMLSHIYQFLNPRRSKAEPTPVVKASVEPDLSEEILSEASWLANTSPREQLLFGDLVLGFDQFTLDQYHHRLVTLKTLPEMTYAGQFAGFVRMPFHYDLILTFEVPFQSNEMAKLQQKRKMAHSLAVTQAGRASDLESESKLSSTEELIRELLNTGQRIYAAQMTVVLKAEATPEGNKKLNREVREVLSRFRALQGSEGFEESVGAWKVLKGNLPAAPINLERARKMKTNNLADFLPVYGPQEGDRDPVVIFRNRLNGLVGFNSFDPNLPNFNSLVTGSSGAGKAF